VNVLRIQLCQVSMGPGAIIHSLLDFGATYIVSLLTSSLPFSYLFITLAFLKFLDFKSRVLT